jgi:hypothetical protein
VKQNHYNLWLKKTLSGFGFAQHDNFLFHADLKKIILIIIICGLKKLYQALTSFSMTMQTKNLGNLCGVPVAL